MSDESRYILGKKIARGGMAEIYLGKQVGEDGFQRVCAIKRILPHYAQDQEFVQMFRDEAHTWKRLQHANIVRVETLEEVEGSYAIIMEYVHGTDLRTLLHTVEQGKQRVPASIACYVIAESARGLHHAHTKIDEITQQPLNIVHRDISPQNILVSFEGEVKVTDFGIAKSNNRMNETKAGIVKGKYSYMSPEQISAKEVDARTDIFALGIVLWEMLAMRRLFQAETEVDTIQRVKNCKIDQDLKALNAEVDDELDAICRKALAKDLKKRYKTAADLEKDLRKYMSKRFPDFTPQDLGTHLKKHLEARRVEADAEVKRTLTETNLKVGAKKAVGKSRAVDLALEDAKAGPAMSIARPTAATRGPTIGSGGGPTSSKPMRPSKSSSSGRPSTGMSRASTSATRGTNATGAMASRRFKSNNTLWIVGAIALLLSFVLVKKVVDQGAKDGHAYVTLRTLPIRVKVTVDGKAASRGRYVTAGSRRPFLLKLKPGQHSIVVSRDGYYPYRLDLQALDSGEKLVKDDIVLREKVPHVRTRLKMRPADRALSLDINDGYFAATMVPGKAAITDLIIGKSYKMRVKVDEGGGEFTCQFTPSAQPPRQPYEVVIDRRAKKCQTGAKAGSEDSK